MLANISIFAKTNCHKAKYFQKFVCLHKKRKCVRIGTLSFYKIRCNMQSCLKVRGALHIAADCFFEGYSAKSPCKGKSSQATYARTGKES